MTVIPDNFEPRSYQRELLDKLTKHDTIGIMRSRKRSDYFYRHYMKQQPQSAAFWVLILDESQDITKKDRAGIKRLARKARKQWHGIIVLP